MTTDCLEVSSKSATSHYHRADVHQPMFASKFICDKNRLFFENSLAFSWPCGHNCTKSDANLSRLIGFSNSKIRIAAAHLEPSFRYLFPSGAGRVSGNRDLLQAKGVMAR
jgi:hypothetical protein